MAVWFIRYKTVGDEVYESETGPTTGYDNVCVGYFVAPEEACDDFDMECYREVDLIAEQETLGM